MPLSFERAHSDGAVAVGEWERVFLMVWRGVPTRLRIERAVDAAHLVARRVSGCVSMLSVIEAGSPPPALADLMYSVRAFDGLVGVLTATAAVLEERPTASAVLDAAALLTSLRRQPTPSRFCADVREAACWLAPRHPHCHPDFRGGLVDAVEALRAELTRHGR